MRPDDFTKQEDLTAEENPSTFSTAPISHEATSISASSAASESILAGSSATNQSSNEDDDHSVGVSRRRTATNEPSSRSLVLSTLLSLLVVLILLLAARFIVPPMLERARYAWHRGQLQAEYDNSKNLLNSVSLDGSWKVSQWIHQRVNPSVVHINTRNDSRAAAIARGIKDLPGSKLSREMAIGQGSGIIVGKNGFILTNNHVLDDSKEIDVFLSDGRRMKAEILGRDKATDLAVLRIDADDLIPIDWGDSDTIEIGAPVWAVGSPFGLTGSITFGILSGKHRADLSSTRYASTGDELTRYGDLMQSDVAVNPGNSGGPLVDAMGHVIGINTAIVGEGYQGISFAITSNVARHVSEKIIATGKVERGWLGIRPHTASAHPMGVAGDRSVQGAVIDGFPDTGPSPGREAGLLVGDSIVGFNGTTVNDSLQLMRMIGEADVGSKVTLDIVRHGEHLQLTSTIGLRP